MQVALLFGVSVPREQASDEGTGAEPRTERLTLLVLPPSVTVREVA